MSRTCWRCGNTYQGYECGYCATKKAHEESVQEQKALRESIEQSARQEQDRHREQLEAMEENARAVQSSQEDAVARHKEITATQWKLQASSMAQEAHKLYRAGLFLEAQSQSLNALRSDQGCTMAYIVSSLSSSALGDEGHSLEDFKKALSLVAVNRDISIVSQVILVELANMQKCGLVAECSTRMALLLKVLSESHMITTHLLDQFLQHEFNSESEQIYGDLFKDSTSLLSIAYCLEIGERQHKTTDNSSLIVFLQQHSSSQRLELFKAFSLIKACKVFSPKIVETIRAAIRERYCEWQDAIHESFKNDAEGQAREKSKTDRRGTFIPFVIMPVMLIALWNMPNWLRTRILNTPIQVVTAIFLTTFIVVSIILGLFLKRITMRSEYRKYFSSFVDRERKALDQL